MPNAMIPGKLKVFESEGYFCASFVAPGYPMLAARDDEFEELAYWLIDVGVEEDILYTDLPIEASISLPQIALMPGAQTLERRFSKGSAFLLAKAANLPPN